MAKIFDNLSREVIDLAEFHLAIDAYEGVQFTEAHIEYCAARLTELANNQDLLWSMVNACQDVAGLANIFSAPQSFVLGKGKAHAVRINFWVPKVENSPFSAHQQALYAYDVAHNHDFRFLTVGYFGAGYETDLYEMDHELVKGIKNEKVVLSNHQRVQLHPKRVIYFEPYKDVHVQHEPTEVSISINLLFTNEVRFKEQLLINIGSSSVIEAPSMNNISRLITAIEFSKFLHNESTLPLLLNISEKHDNKRVCQSASETASGLTSTSQ